MNTKETQMRKLASIQKVIDLQPISGADKIEVATVLGWQCVVKKGEFQVGDLCCYFEIDSILPPKPEYAFLEKSKYRIKTIRLRKQVSQGLAVPVPESCKKYKEDADVTDVLGVIKYDSEAVLDPVGSVPRKPKTWWQKLWSRLLWKLGLADKTGSLGWPSFLQKTDEERIQSCPSLLAKHADEVFYVTEKLDGSSCTVYQKGEHFGCCSRNRELPRRKDTNGGNIDARIWAMVKAYGLEQQLKLVKRDIAIQGELIGPGIQSNKYKLDKHEYRVFRVFDIAKRQFLAYPEAVKLIESIGLKWCPYLGEFKLQDYSTVDKLVELSKGESSKLTPVKREGIVVRSLEGATSFKVINPEFLLEHSL